MNPKESGGEVGLETTTTRNAYIYFAVEKTPQLLVVINKVSTVWSVPEPQQGLSQKLRRYLRRFCFR